MAYRTAFVKIADIDQGKRGRKVYEKIKELADSIENHGGLINPITLIEKPNAEMLEQMRDPNKLFILKTGGRRLAAHCLIHAEDIEARIYEGDISLAEFRKIELEENLQRENLTWQEEVAMKEEYVRLTKEMSGEHVPNSTIAANIKVSQGNLSQDLKVANAMKVMPELAKVKTKTEALKLINKAEESAVTQELARRATLKANEGGADKKKRGLLESYIVGDAFELIKRVPDASMDFIELDPPYGIGYEGMHDGRTDQNPNVADFTEWTPEEYEQFLTKISLECNRTLRDKCWGICWHSIWRIGETQRALAAAGFDVALAPIIWHKPGQGRNRTPSSRFTIDYEVATYFRKGIAQLNRQGPGSTLIYQTDKSSRHPTQKPVGMLCSLLECFIAPNSRILVPFLGSGNTIIAASKINCLAFGFDLSPAYKDSYTLAVEEMFATVPNAVGDADI